jgi:hypothetical protein
MSMLPGREAAMSTTVKRGYFDIDCGVIGEAVRVTVDTHSLYGQGHFPVDHARQMIACTGNATCGKFVIPAAFKAPASNGCPFHEALNRRPV